MTEPEKPSDAKEPDAAAPAAAAPAEPAQEPATEKASEPAKKAPASGELDPYWWAPWVVLVGLVLYGLLGFLGVLFPQRKGPTAADVPVAPAASDKRPVPAR